MKNIRKSTNHIEDSILSSLLSSLLSSMMSSILSEYFWPGPGGVWEGADGGPIVLLHYQDYCEVIIDHYNSIYTQIHNTA